MFTRASVTFAPGTMIATFTVDITDDSMVEPNENFIINIDQSSLPDGVVVVDPSQVTVTIVDNDGECACITPLVYAVHAIQVIIPNLKLLYTVNLS